MTVLSQGGLTSAGRRKRKSCEETAHRTPTISWHVATDEKAKDLAGRRNVSVSELLAQAGH